MIITDKDLNELDRGSWVVNGFTKEELEALPEFHQKNFRDPISEGMHDETMKETTNSSSSRCQFPPLNLGDDDKYDWYGGNGLFSDIMDSTKSKSLSVIQDEMLTLIKKYCPFEGSCSIAGCSVGCDRELLRFQMPKVYGHLNHRVVDTSTVLGGMVDVWCPYIRNDEIRGLDAFKRRNGLTNVKYTHRALDDCAAAIVLMKWIRECFFLPFENLAPNDYEMGIENT